MTKNKLSTFTFIADFRGGTYCSQVLANDVNHAVSAWIKKLKLDINEIQYLGDKIIKNLEVESNKIDNQPVQLRGLKNVWYSHYSTRKGSFRVNIVKTEIDI
jgi:hypothetical protein